MTQTQSEPRVAEPKAAAYTALLIPVAGPVEEVVLDGTLQQLQDAVGGWIRPVNVPEAFDPDGHATAYVNEEGRLGHLGTWTDAAGHTHDGLPFNGRATDFLVPGIGIPWGDYIAGAMLVCPFDPNTGEHDLPLPESVVRRIRLIEREAGPSEAPVEAPSEEEAR